MQNQQIIDKLLFIEEQLVEKEAELMKESILCIEKDAEIARLRGRLAEETKLRMEMEAWAKQNDSGEEMHAQMVRLQDEVRDLRRALAATTTTASAGEEQRHRDATAFENMLADYEMPPEGPREVQRNVTIQTESSMESHITRALAELDMVDSLRPDSSGRGVGGVVQPSESLKMINRARTSSYVGGRPLELSRTESQMRSSARANSFRKLRSSMLVHQYSPSGSPAGSPRDSQLLGSLLNLNPNHASGSRMDTEFASYEAMSEQVTVCSGQSPPNQGGEGSSSAARSLSIVNSALHDRGHSLDSSGGVPTS